LFNKWLNKFHLKMAHTKTYMLYLENENIKFIKLILIDVQTLMIKFM